jgi:hypothetical protein
MDLPIELYGIVATKLAEAYGPRALMHSLGAVSRALRGAAKAAFASDPRAWVVTSAMWYARAFTGIKRLDARGIWPNDASAIPSSVEDLRVSRFDCVRNLAHLALRSIDVSTNTEGMYTLDAFAAMTGLRSLRVTNCPNLVDVTALARLRSLESLCLGECWSLTSIAAVSSLANLTCLDLSFATNVTELPELPSGLRSLRLHCFRGIESIKPITALSDLVELDLSLCSGIDDVSPLLTLPNLAHLRFATPMFFIQFM